MFDTFKRKADRIRQEREAGRPMGCGYIGAAQLLLKSSQGPSRVLV